jgi:MFS family permease
VVILTLWRVCVSSSTGDASRRWRLGRGAAFANASLAMTAMFAAAGVPAPLYSVYEEEFGITAAGITGSYAAYIVSAALAMLCGGRLTDHLGRRPVVMVTLATAVAACVVLLRLEGPGMLVLGRVLQGVVVGVAMSGVGAYVVDLRRPGTTFLASLVASASPTLGVGLGAVGSGLLVDYAPWPRHLAYVVTAAVLLLCLCGVLLSRETVALPRGLVDWRQARGSLRPRLAVPARKRRMFLGVIGAFLASWTLGGLYQSLGPSFATELLHRDEHLYAGLVVASVLATTATGGPLTSRMAPRTGTLAGLALLCAGMVAILLTLRYEQPVLFLAASVAAGAGFGAATTGSMRSLLRDAHSTEVAGLLAAVYLVSYLGAAVPAFFGGRLVEPLGLLHTAYAYGALVVALAVVAGIVAVASSRKAGTVEHEPAAQHI